MGWKENRQKLIAWYTPLPGWAKGVIIIGGAATAIYTVHVIVKSIRDKKALAKSQEEVMGYIKDLADLANAGIVPSYQQSQYQIWAASIQQQFDGCDFSLPTCPDIITSLSYSASGQKVHDIATQLKNNADFLALQAAWAIRSYHGCISWLNGMVKDVTLSGAIADELDQCEVSGLNDVLASNNITYTF